MSCPKCGKNEKHFCPPSLGEPGFYVCEMATDPKPPVPDRVIDAPIPADLTELYEICCGEDSLKPSISYFVSTTAELIERIARLEAEKQEARRIGLEFALHRATETADWCIEEQEKGYLGAMRVADAIKRELSKPTAAQPVEKAKPESEKEGEL